MLIISMFQVIHKEFMHIFAIKESFLSILYKNMSSGCDVTK